MTYVAAVTLSKINLVLVTGPSAPLPVETSFSHIIEHILGTKFKLLNNISIVFIMMILMYAYTTAGARIISHVTDLAGLHLADDYRAIVSVSFAAIIALVVVMGTSLVSRVSLLFVLCMLVLFALAAFEIQV